MTGQPAHHVQLQTSCNRKKIWPRCNVISKLLLIKVSWGEERGSKFGGDSPLKTVSIPQQFIKNFAIYPPPPATTVNPY